MGTLIYRLSENNNKRRYNCHKIATISIELSEDFYAMKESSDESTIIKMSHPSSLDVSRALSLHTSPSKSSTYGFYSIDNISQSQLHNHPNPIQNIQDIVLSSYKYHQKPSPCLSSLNENSSSIYESHSIDNTPPSQLSNHPNPLINIKDIALSSYKH